MSTTAQPPVFDGLKSAMRGPVLQPADDGYDAARAVYNGMINRRPAAIARCADVADVMTAVRFGRENGLTVSVRGGGHNAGGLGVWDDALVIDLSGMRGTRVDPATKTAIAQMVQFLQETKGITKTQAYQAASMAADLHITQLVDGNVGVHMMIAKSYLK